MKVLALIAVSLLTAGCATNPEKRVPRVAADAMTGSPWTLTAVASLTMEGTATIREHGSDSPSVASFKRVLNFRKRHWRGDMTVASGSPGSGLERVSMGVIGNRIFHTNNAVVEPQLQSEVLRHPIGFLQAAFSGTSQLSGTRSMDGMDAVDVTVDGRVYTLFLDGTTRLPAKIVTAQHLPTGDMTMETAFPSYIAVHGYKLPSRIVTKVAGMVVEDLKIEQQVASADSVDLAVPDGH